MFQKFVFLILLSITDLSPTHGVTFFGMKFGSRKNHNNSKTTNDVSVSVEPVVAPKCIACYGDMVGHDVERTRYSGFTEEQKDRSCRDNCLTNHLCEFWVRSTKSSDCFLKQGFRSYVDMEPSENFRGGFRRPEEDLGVVFIKQPKTGGETLAEILAQYSVKYGRKVLHDVSCINKKNPMGQSTCACHLHFVRNSRETLPSSDPFELPRFSMLYTHMFYSPAVLNYFMPPTASQRLITIIRHPIEVLKSAQKMALLQKHSKTDHMINNSFCQPISHDLELWLTKCPMAAEGTGTILNYLDSEAHEALSKILKTAKGRLAAVDEELARSTLNRAKQRLGDFIVGTQSHFDESVLLFEAALGWERSDSVYSYQSMVLHSAGSHPLAKKVDEQWGNQRAEMIELMVQRYSPIQYHIELYKHGVEIHKQQVAKYLGDSRQVALAVEMYKLQNDKFTVCYENFKRSHPFDTCSQKGLWEASRARHVCASTMKRFDQTAL